MVRITAVVAVIGPGGVGKSSCTLRYLKDVFMTEYDPTIEECYKKTITLDGKRTNIEILDTAGQEEFAMFRDVTLSYAHGFMIVFALNDEASWKEAVELHSTCQKKYPNIPTLFVGNKTDLASEIVVDRSQVAKYCHDNGFQYMETSAKTGDNVTNAFESIIRRVRDNHFQSPPKTKKSFCALM